MSLIKSYRNLFIETVCYDYFDYEDKKRLINEEDFDWKICIPDDEKVCEEIINSFESDDMNKIYFMFFCYYYHGFKFIIHQFFNLEIYKIYNFILKFNENLNKSNVDTAIKNIINEIQTIANTSQLKRLNITSVKDRYNILFKIPADYSYDFNNCEKEFIEETYRDDVCEFVKQKVDIQKLFELIKSEDINFINKALMWCCRYNCLEGVKNCLEKDADVNFCINNYCDCLIIACETNNKGIIKLILDKKPSIDKYNTYNNPFTISFKKNDIELCKLLLENNIYNNKYKPYIYKENECSNYFLNSIKID